MKVLTRIISLILVISILCSISICAISPDNSTPFSVSVDGKAQRITASSEASDVPIWDVTVAPGTTTISISNVVEDIVGIWGTKYIDNDYEAAVILSERNENGPLATGENAYDQSTGTYTVHLADFESINEKTLVPLIGNDYFDTGVEKISLRVSYSVVAPFVVRVGMETYDVDAYGTNSDGVSCWNVIVPDTTSTIRISDVADNIVGVWGTKYIENDYEAAVILSERNENGPLASGKNEYDQSTGTYTVQLDDFEFVDEKTLVPLIGNDYFDTGIQSAFLYVTYFKTSDKSKLSSAIDSVPDETGYYTQDDRYNGSVYQEAGFWSDMQLKLSNAKDVLKDSGASQEKVDKATADLIAAIKSLISKKNINPTILYEALNTTWRWWQGELSNTTGTPVSADNCTAITWDAYEKAKADGQALLDSLYDDKGNPVDGVNTADKQDTIDAAAETVDAHKLVNADLYNTAYENYLSSKAEAEALIEQYNPTKLNESDYSAESWAAYVSAYNVLKADMEYRIVGGTTEDYAMLKAFKGYYAYNESGQWTHYPAHIDALKDARKQLVSNKDVTVSFTYINNFSALYEGFRGNGTDLYANASLGLTSGNATLGAAFDAAGITVDMHNDSTLPGLDTTNNGDTNPVFALYVNGSYYGDYRWSGKASWNNVQLHADDVVRMVRIPLQMFESEDSSGYDSSAVSVLPATAVPEYYESSYAMIHASAPASTTVGDQAAFSATVTGAYAGASGSKSAENITLFISDPAETETLSQPTHKTTATTDASGNLEYIFREPGYYTIAMFNVIPDDMTFQSIYREVTLGEYYSLYAGDYAIVHVTEAADMNALLTRYRSKNLATAKAYYDGFHDYDFTSENYQELTAAYNTLKSNQTSAATFKALMDAFDTDYAALQAAGAKALDHAAIIAAIRKNLSYLPDDLTTLTASDKDFVVELQTAYAALNAYQKSLLTANERATLEALAKINANELPTVATVNLKLSESGTFPHNMDGGNPYYGWPEIKWVISPRPDGSVPNPTWAKETTSMPTSAKAGQYVFIRYYLTTTDAQYWPVWSIDGGTTWNRATAQTLIAPDDTARAYPGYYLISYQIPKNAEDGNTITFSTKMVSKTDYQRMFETLDDNAITKLKKAAIAVVESAFNACEKSKYDEAGIAKLEAALKSGKDAINAATTESEIKDARDKAVAEIKAVPEAGKTIKTGETKYNSGTTVGTVTVSVENTTYSAAPFTGTIVSGEYELGENDSMMTVVLKALELGGYTWNDDIEDLTSDSYTKTTYIASIHKGSETLAEKDGSKGAGWMGTKNDWFVNQGFAAFTYKNGSLKSGDVIRVMFTTNLGEDIGGSWTNNETTLSNLQFSSGKLTPAYSSATTDYLLVIPSEQIGTRINYSAANKNFQTRAYLNTYGSDNAYYANGDIMAVSSGDVIYVGVGDKSWPTMNKASNYTTTRYTITVVQNGNAADVQKLISNLPSPGKITLASASDVRTAKAQFDLLTDAQKTEISEALKKKLNDCYTAITDMEAAKIVSDAIAALPATPTVNDIGTIRSAEEAYNKLTDNQKGYLTQREVNKLNNAVSVVSTLEVGYVTGLIATLPAKDAVTAQDRAKIEAARAAYNNLTEAQQKLVSNYSRLTDAEEALENLGTTAIYEQTLQDVLAYVKDQTPNPSIGSTYGEWAVLAEARGNVSASVWYDEYLSNMAKTVVSMNGRLDNTKTQTKHTEYSRVILALTSIGEDATKFTGSNGTVYNLVEPLFEKNGSTYRVSEQGNNGTAFALIALDSGNYYDNATGTTARNAWIKSLCDAQINNGAWGIDTDFPGSNVDMTAMVVQALAPYCSTNATVKAAVDKAVEWLSAEYQKTGDYGSSESAAQVIVALSALNIDAKIDSRFQHNGISVLSNFLSYADPNSKGFLHDKQPNSTVNQMASEQAAYTLVAYDRYVNGSKRLYDMSDVTKRENADAQAVIDMINQIGYVDESSYNAIAEARNAYNKLSAADKEKVENYNTLTAAETSYKAILKQKQTDQYKALKAHYDDLLNDKTKKYGTAAKKKLASILQQAQTDMNAAESCERVTAIYEKAITDLDAVKPGDIEVTFRLIGALEATQDVDLTTDSYLPEYVTWVPTKTYALQENATVYDLFTEAMSDAGLRYIGAESNYVSTIYAPSCLGGYPLSEFTNGKKSGWMYTVNGTHPNQGLKNWTLNDNDVVVWHYVNDYSHEVADWFNDPNYPSLGNGTYYNGWLRAADISPEQYVNELLGKILKVGKNGTVEPKLTFQHIGKSVTFTFKPDTGYKVKDVKVNGKSVGAVKTYTIDKLTVSTRIEVEFTDESLPFTDVRRSDWFYEDVAFAYENGLFAGTSDTTFSPNASMTRAMLVTVLYRLEGQPAVNGRSGFSDVQYNGYYEDAVTWAADNGIVNGTSTTTFSPNANVTREQMAAILYRYAQYKKYNTAASSGLNGFTDHASVSGYAAASLEWAVAEKLVNGSAGKLMPTGNATRAQVAAILHRFVENVAKTTK